MQARAENKNKTFFSGLYCVAFMLISAYAGMQFTGRLAFQIILTFSLTLIFTFVADILKIKINAKNQ